MPFSCRHLLRLLVLLAALLGATGARAHNAPGSSVSLDFFRAHIVAELRLPLSELELSFGQPLLTVTASDTAPTAHPTAALGSTLPPAEILARIARHRSALVAYLVAHIQPRAPDGRAWTVAVTALSVSLDEAIPDLVVQLHLTPPPGAPLRRFTLNYDVILHEVINHIVFVFVRRDWNHAVFADRPESLAPLRFFNKTLTLDRTGGSVWVGARHRLLAACDRLTSRAGLALLLLVSLPLAALTRWILRHRTARYASPVSRPPR